MNFKGSDNYQHLQYYTFPDIPNFRKQRKTESYEMHKFQNFFYQFNIAQILQWIEYIEQEASTPFSRELYRLEYNEKDEQKVYIMAKNKLNLVQSFGNTGLFFLKKICKKCTEYPSIFNEYFVTIYALNFLRFKCPTFNFTYSFHKTNRVLSIKQEFSHGVDFHTFLETCSMDDFANILFQIILSLEIAQRHLLFTHYDLNTENIIIETVKDPFTIQLGNQTYRFEKFMIKIIDFGFSSVNTSPNTIFSNCASHLYHYGYFPFFTPGTDLFRILGQCLFETTGKKQDFSAFIMEHLYGVKAEKFKSQIHLFRKNYFNCSCFPFIYKIPLDCICFLESLSISSLRKFDIEHFGFRSDQRNLRNRSAVLDKSFENIFSLGSIHTEIHYDPLDKIYIGRDVQEHGSLPKTFPNFIMESISTIDTFYRKHYSLLDGFTPDSMNLEDHRCFRVLSCMHQFLEFYNLPFFQYSDRSQQEVKQYCKPLLQSLG